MRDGQRTVGTTKGDTDDSGGSKGRPEARKRRALQRGALPLLRLATDAPHGHLPRHLWLARLALQQGRNRREGIPPRSASIRASWSGGSVMADESFAIATRHDDTPNFGGHTYEEHVDAARRILGNIEQNTW